MDTCTGVSSEQTPRSTRQSNATHVSGIWISTTKMPPSYGVPTGPRSVPVRCLRLPPTGSAVIPLVSGSLLHSASSLRMRVMFIPPAAAIVSLGTESLVRQRSQFCRGECWCYFDDGRTSVQKFDRAWALYELTRKLSRGSWTMESTCCPFSLACMKLTRGS